MEHRHCRGQQLAPSAPASHRQPALDADAVAQLESLDDVIFPAIEGDPAALAASAAVWREAVKKLPPDDIMESRSEYLRYARATWQFLTSQTVQQPLRMFAVMKIIGLLTGDDA